MYSLKSIIIVLIFSLTASAQNFTLGEVSRLELEQKVHPSDSAATAAVLYSKGKTYFVYAEYYWIVVTEVEQRIKIYKKDGYKYGRHKLRFRKGNKFPNFTDAVTYNLVDDKIEKTPIDSTGIFLRELNNYYDEKEIVMPNVRDGSVIEYKYVISTLYYPELQGWFFEDFIPINHTSYTVSIPSYFTYNSILSGKVKVNQSDQEVKRFDGYNQSTITYSADNVKAISDEPFVHNLNNYRSRLKLELVATTNFATETTHLATTWPSLVKMIYEDEDFGKQLEPMSFFKKEIKELITDGMVPLQKMSVIFAHVQSHMTWNERLGFTCQLGIKEAYKSKTGNVADINLMLVNMLRAAGLRAYPILLSTRSNGIANYPSFMAYNYVIAAVDVDNRVILLDATDKNAYHDILPPRAMNWTGRMVREDGTVPEIDVMPKQSSRNRINIIAALSEDGTVEGRLNRQYSDYSAYTFRNIYSAVGSEKYLEALEKVTKGTTIENHKVVNDKDLSKPVVEDYSFTSTQAADIINGRMYLKPMLFLSEDENPFRQETRQYPIDFDYPYEDKFNITINLPPGYTVESLPEPLSLVFGEKLLVFRYTVQATNNQVQLNVVYQLNHSYLSQENYSALRDFFMKMIDKQNEKIVLKKK